jgi:hypothetical protein
MCKIKNWKMTLMLYNTSVLWRSFVTFATQRIEYRISKFLNTYTCYVNIHWSVDAARLLYKMFMVLNDHRQVRWVWRLMRFSSHPKHVTFNQEQNSKKGIKTLILISYWEILNFFSNLWSFSYCGADKRIVSSLDPRRRCKFTSKSSTR